MVLPSPLPARHGDACGRGALSVALHAPLALLRTSLHPPARVVAPRQLAPVLLGGVQVKAEVASLVSKEEATTQQISEGCKLCATAASRRALHPVILARTLSPTSPPSPQDHRAGNGDCRQARSLRR